MPEREGGLVGFYSDIRGGVAANCQRDLQKLFSLPACAFRPYNSFLLSFLSSLLFNKCLLIWLFSVKKLYLCGAIQDRSMTQKEIAEDIRTAVQTLREGGIILYPTDTIWGIGCDASNEEAVKRIFQLKRREDSKARE